MSIIDSPSVAIIILNWNNWQDTVECVQSLQRVDYPNYQLIIVDNGSENDSIAQIKLRYRDSLVLETGENLGFSGGVNVGINHALESGADLILLINNDTLVEKDFMSRLVAAMDADERIGIIGSKIYYFNDKQKIWAAGGGITRLLKRTYHRGQDKLDRGQFDRQREVDFLSGCCLLIRRQVFEKIGLFDPVYFMYYEDVDFCLRSKRAAFSVVYCPTATIWHKVSATSVRSYRDYYRMRNHIIFAKRYFNFSKMTLILVSAFIYFERLLRIFVRKLILQDKERLIERIKNISLGFLNGLNN